MRVRAVSPYVLGDKSGGGLASLYRALLTGVGGYF